MTKDDQFDRLLGHAARARAGRGPSGECIDAETLAAWTEGRLSAGQRSAAEIHAADCERCLGMLAAMAQTTPPPNVPQTSRWFFLRWAAPLTTAAVAITAWLVIQGPPPGPADSLPASDVAGAPKPAEPSRHTEVDSSAKTLTDAIEEKTTSESSRRDALEKSRQVAGGRTAPRKSERSEAPAALAETRAAERRRAPAAAPPATAAPVPPPADARVDARDQAVQQRFAAQQPVVITSPDPDIRWRIVDRGVQRSTDAGRTWAAQQPQVEGELLAGASPAPNVCWVVGTPGIVLLTTDGKTWRRIAFPDPTATLVAAGAVSAVDATVSTSDGRVYRTSDGGGTWTLQENPRPSF